jgi:hypothetical protein
MSNGRLGQMGLELRGYAYMAFSPKVIDLLQDVRQRVMVLCSDQGVDIRKSLFPVFARDLPSL